MARYFIHLPRDGSTALFWRGLAGFARESIHINLNLLAHAVGDDPAAPRSSGRDAGTSTGLRGRKWWYRGAGSSAFRVHVAKRRS